MVRKPSDYTIDLDANIMVKSVTNNLRVNLTIKLSTSHVWEEFGLRANMRPNSWGVAFRRRRENRSSLVN